MVGHTPRHDWCPGRPRFLAVFRPNRCTICSEIERLASSLRDRAHRQTRCGRKRLRGRRPERMHMKVAGRVLTSLVLVCATAALAAGQGAPVDEQALKKEVNAFMDQY